MGCWMCLAGPPGHFSAVHAYASVREVADQFLCAGSLAVTGGLHGHQAGHYL